MSNYAERVHDPEAQTVGSTNTFWRPALQERPQQVYSSPKSETCDRCATEFIVGSRFCHVCGADRQSHTPANRFDFGRVFRLLSFPNLMSNLGLSAASLVLLIAGSLCLAAALATGFIYSPRTVLDWQAIQIWRVQWLLGCIACISAAHLLKRC